MRTRLFLPGLALATAFTLAVQAQPASTQAQRSDPQNTILMETTKGRVTIVLRPDLAPKHAERIKQLTREKFYDNAPFHRVIPGFMAQTGDGAKGDGTGGSKYPNLAAEFSNAPFTRGVVGMARSSNPNSANSQFFICYDGCGPLTGQYTLFGEVVSGMDVVDKIKKGDPNRNGQVTSPDKIVRMQLAADAR